MTLLAVPANSDGHPATDDPWLPEHLVLSLASVGTTFTLVLRGRLDGDSVVALSTQIDQLASSSIDRLVVDVTGLDVLDRAGSDALHRLSDLVGRRGGVVSLRDGDLTLDCGVTVDPHVLNRAGDPGRP